MQQKNKFKFLQIKLKVMRMLVQVKPITMSIIKKEKIARSIIIITTCNLKIIQNNNNCLLIMMLKT